MDTSRLFVLLLQLAILLMSIVIHEYAHGWIAFRLGDSTAKDHGRLTLNPIKHLDLFGSCILPLIMLFISGGQMMFGYAKPVPINMANLKDPKKDIVKVAAAGPIANLSVALTFGLILRFTQGNIAMAPIFVLIVILNILLGVLNLLPIPPLDGSNIFLVLLPDSYNNIKMFIMKYGMIILMAFIVFGGLRWLFPIILLIFRLITGLSLT